MGFRETIQFQFVSKSDLEKWQIQNHPYFSKTISLKNPISDDLTHMQPTLLINLVHAVMRNQNKGNFGSRLFNSGKVMLDFRDDSTRENAITWTQKARSENRFYEREMIAGVIDFPLEEKLWFNQNEKEPEFFYGKNILERWLKSLGLNENSLTWQAINANDFPFYHPGKAALLKSKDKILGTLGLLSPAILKSLGMDWKKPVLAFEMDMQNIYLVNQELQKSQKIHFALSSFPPLSRDFAWLVEQSMSHQQMIEALENFPNRKYFTTSSLFDLYEGDKLPKGKKSMAYHLYFQSHDKTLNEKDVEQETQKLLQWMKEKVGAELRI